MFFDTFSPHEKKLQIKTISSEWLRGFCIFIAENVAFWALGPECLMLDLDPHTLQWMRFGNPENVGQMHTNKQTKEVLKFKKMGGGGYVHLIRGCGSEGDPAGAAGQAAQVTQLQVVGPAQRTTLWRNPPIK